MHLTLKTFVGFSPPGRVWNWDQWESAYLAGNIPREVPVWNYLMDLPILYYDNSRTDLVANQHPLTPHSTNRWSELHVCLYWELMSTVDSPNSASTLEIRPGQFSGLGLRRHPLLTGSKDTHVLTFPVCVPCWISDRAMHSGVGDTSHVRTRTLIRCRQEYNHDWASMGSTEMCRNGEDCCAFYCVHSNSQKWSKFNMHLLWVGIAFFFHVGYILKQYYW